ncbi:uncharacterized protein LOC134847879 isoform X3 [Symsagittifera roscoffensis]|uniref:uncharacterized protein LOC134847879 isoform X3 n=1 Tax=Symsagittifera roscoffensis TaxID=84072 RepID=UPI00307C40E3
MDAELVRKIEDIKSQLNETCRQEKECNRLKLENTIKFPMSALVPDPLHDQIVSQISQNKLNLMSQLKSNEFRLSQMRYSQNIHNLNSHSAHQFIQQPNSFTPLRPSMQQQNFHQFSSRSAHEIGGHLARPRPPFGGSLPRGLRPIEVHRNVGGLQEGSSEFIFKKPNVDSSNNSQEFLHPRNPAPCSVRLDNSPPGESSDGYVVVNHSMFNRHRYETDPEFKDWCIKYNIVVLNKSPDRTKLVKEPHVVTSNRLHAPERNDRPLHRTVSNYSRPEAAMVNPRDGLRNGNLRSSSNDLSVIQIDHYSREFFDENHGPDPSHPYYHIWYTKFIKKAPRDYDERMLSSIQVEPKPNPLQFKKRLDDMPHRRLGNSSRNFDHRVATPSPPEPPSMPRYHLSRQDHQVARTDAMFNKHPVMSADIDERQSSRVICSTPEPPQPINSTPPPPPPPMVPPPEAPEKPADVYQLDQMLSVPGRKEQQRLRNSLIIMRGPPGSGKSYIAKLIKDKETAAGMTAPRILSIDDYFMVSDDSTPKGGKGGGMVYEYEEDMETVYLSALCKALSKVVAEGSDRLIIVDACNHLQDHFTQFVQVAQKSLMKTYIIEMQPPMSVCVEQNIHGRTEVDIKNIIENWEEAPNSIPRLDPSHFMSSRALEQAKENDKKVEMTKGKSANNVEGRKGNVSQSSSSRPAPPDKSQIEPRKRQRSDSMEMSDAEDTIDDVIIQTNPTTAKKPTSEDYYQPAEPTVSIVWTVSSEFRREPLRTRCRVSRSRTS